MATWRRGLAVLALLVLGPVPPAFAQAYAPSFDLIVSGAIVHVTGDQTFDYGSHPPGTSISAQVHNGPNPECAFTATRSDTGASQYQNIGGSNGYDTSGHYTDPPQVVLALPVPIVWNLTLACGPAGIIKVTVSTELPPPPPPPPPPPSPPPPSPSPAAGPGSHAAPPAPVTPSRPGPPPRPAPSAVGKALPALVPVATPVVVPESPTPPTPVAAASPSPSPSPSRSPSQSPSRSPLSAPRASGGHGPSFLRFFLIAIGAVVVLVAILYAAGLRWVRVDDDGEDG